MADASDMKTLRIILMVGIFVGFSAQAAQDVEHVLKKGETVWFLAQLYYGKGEHFEKILKASQVELAAVHVGQMLKIPDATYSPQSSDFEKRFQNLWAERQQKLEAKQKRGIAQEPSQPKLGKVLEAHQLVPKAKPPKKAPQEVKPEAVSGFLLPLPPAIQDSSNDIRRATEELKE